MRNILSGGVVLQGLAMRWRRVTRETRMQELWKKCELVFGFYKMFETLASLRVGMRWLIEGRALRRLPKGRRLC